MRAIGNDLHMDYTAVGQTTHLAARMEQMATPGIDPDHADDAAAGRGLRPGHAAGAGARQGAVSAPVEVYELVGARAARTRLQAAAARGLTRFVGRDSRAGGPAAGAGARRGGHGQVVALVGRAGRGQVAAGLGVHPLPPHPGLAGAGERLGVLRQGHALSPGHRPAQALLPGRGPRRPRTIREKVTGQVLTLDEALQDTVPALLALLDALPVDSRLPAARSAAAAASAPSTPQAPAAAREPGAAAAAGLRGPALDRRRDPGAARQPGREPAHRPAPAAGQLPPGVQHGWGSKTYYTQLRLDPLPAGAPTSCCRPCWGTTPAWPLKRC